MSTKKLAIAFAAMTAFNVSANNALDLATQVNDAFKQGAKGVTILSGGGIAYSVEKSEFILPDRLAAIGLAIATPCVAAYNACTKENAEAVAQTVKDGAMTAYNACTKENAQALAQVVKENAIVAKDAVVEGATHTAAFVQEHPKESATIAVATAVTLSVIYAVYNYVTAKPAKKHKNK